MSQVDVVQTVKARCLELLSQSPGSIALQEALEQILYVEAALLDGHADRSRLGDTTLGMLAAREFEVRNPPFAESLYFIEEIVDQMRAGML